MGVSLHQKTKQDVVKRLHHLLLIRNLLEIIMKRIGFSER